MVITIIMLWTEPCHQSVFVATLRPKKKLFGSCNPPGPLKTSRLLTFYWLGAPNIYMLVSFNRAIKYEINLFR